MNAPKSQAYRRAADAISAAVAGDYVALHVARGSCFGMADVSAEIWSMLESPTTLDAIVDHLTQEYDVTAEQCRSEVGDVLDLMIQEGLVEPAQ